MAQLNREVVVNVRYDWTSFIESLRDIAEALEVAAASLERRSEVTEREDD